MCDTSYAAGEIENQLVGLIHNHSVALVLQDLQCERCLEVAISALIEQDFHCTLCQKLDLSF